MQTRSMTQPPVSPVIRYKRGELAHRKAFADTLFLFANRDDLTWSVTTFPDGRPIDDQCSLLWLCEAFETTEEYPADFVGLTW